MSFNKYLFTIVLLFMATFHLNLLGFLYFLLFLLHTFAYYSMRSKSSPSLTYRANTLVTSCDDLMVLANLFIFCYT